MTSPPPNFAGSLTQHSARHLGGDMTLTSNATIHENNNNHQNNKNHASTYASHTFRSPHKHCWLKIAIFDAFPKVPSVFGREVQEGKISFDEKNKKVNYLEPNEEKNYYYDNTIDNKHLLDILTIPIELYTDEAPLTAENFYTLCNPFQVDQHMETQNKVQQTLTKTCAENIHVTKNMNYNDVHLYRPDEENTATYQYKDVMPSYKGTFFHKIIKNFIIQGGDITLHVEKDGKNYHHTEGGQENHLNTDYNHLKNVFKFHDESKKRRHNEVGLLSMANNGPNTNATQFFIVSEVSNNSEKVLNGKHTIFGKIMSESKNKKEQDAFQLLLQYLKSAGDVQGHPSKFAIVIDCGQGLPEENNNNENNNNTTIEHESEKQEEQTQEKVTIENNNNNETAAEQKKEVNSEDKSKLKSSMKKTNEKSEKHVKYES